MELWYPLENDDKKDSSQKTINILDPIVNRQHRFVFCVLASGYELLQNPMSDLVRHCQIIIILYIIIMNQEYNDFRTPILMNY